MCKVSEDILMLITKHFLLQNVYTLDRAYTGFDSELTFKGDTEYPFTKGFLTEVYKYVKNFINMCIDKSLVFFSSLLIFSYVFA